MNKHCFLWSTIQEKFLSTFKAENMLVYYIPKPNNEEDTKEYKSL